MRRQANFRVWFLLCVMVLACAAAFVAPTQAIDCTSNCYFKYDDCMSRCGEWDIWCARSCEGIRDTCLSTCRRR